MLYHKIYPLPLCNLRLDKGAFTYLVLANYGEKITFPVYSWLIEAEEPILVDVGCSAEEFPKYVSYRVLPGEIKDIASIEESLARFGFKTSDIKTIIMTHLDTDHILNAKKFPKAKFVVQGEELSFIRNPHPSCAYRYHP